MALLDMLKLFEWCFWLPRVCIVPSLFISYISLVLDFYFLKQFAHIHILKIQHTHKIKTAIIVHIITKAVYPSFPLKSPTAIKLKTPESNDATQYSN